MSTLAKWITALIYPTGFVAFALLIHHTLQDKGVDPHVHISS